MHNEEGDRPSISLLARGQGGDGDKWSCKVGAEGQVAGRAQGRVKGYAEPRTSRR